MGAAALVSRLFSPPMTHGQPWGRVKRVALFTGKGAKFYEMRTARTA